MDTSLLKKNKKKVLEAISLDPENFLIVAEKSVSIMVPEHYFNGKLGNITERYNVLGVFAIIADDSYAVSMIQAHLPLTPEEVNTLVVDGLKYYEFKWMPGGIICPNYRLPQTPALVYDVYDEFVAKGRMPWYLKRRERAELFYSAKRFAGVNLGDEQELQSIFCASCDRDHKDLTKFARTALLTQADYDAYPVSFIPLRSVALGTDNTTAKMLGSYLEQGTISALVNPTETAEEVESLLRA